MRWDVIGSVKNLVSKCCNAIVRAATSVWGVLSRLASAVGLFFITVGAFLAIAIKDFGGFLGRLFRRLAIAVWGACCWLWVGLQMALRWLGALFVCAGVLLKQLFAWQAVLLHVSKAAKFVIRGLHVLISSVVPGVLLLSRVVAMACRWLWSGLNASLRWLGKRFVFVGMLLKRLFLWQGVVQYMGKVVQVIGRSLCVVGNAVVSGVLFLGRVVAMACRWVWACIMASMRWLMGTLSFVGRLFGRMGSWRGFVRYPGRALQAVRGFSRAFVNKAVLLNPPFYLVYTVVSLVVMLAIGSLVYWQYGNVFTRYAVAQHQAVGKQVAVENVMEKAVGGSAAEVKENINQLQDIQNRLEARITATEQRLKELETKTVSLAQKTEEQLEDVTQSVDERVEKFEQKAQRFVEVVAQKTKALDQKAGEQQAAFQQTVAKVEKHVSAMDTKAKKIDSISRDVHKTVTALGKTTKQQVDRLARKIDEKTGAVERNVQQQVALVHKKIDTTHQATQQKLMHLESGIDEKTAAVEQNVHKQMATLEHKVAADVEVGIGKQAQHIAKVQEHVAGLQHTMNRQVADLEKDIAAKTAAVEQNMHKVMEQQVDSLETSIDEKTTAVAAQAKQQLAQVREQLNEQVAAVDKKVDTATLHQQKGLEQQSNRIDTLEKDTQQKIKDVNQKTAEVESRVGTLERTDVQEARRLSVIGHHVQQEVDTQMKALREQATERKKKADRKKVLERFLDQLAESED
jgi:hypothetical protein